MADAVVGSSKIYANALTKRATMIKMSNGKGNLLLSQSHQE